MKKLKNFYKLSFLVLSLFMLNTLNSSAQLVKFGLKAGIDVAENKISKDIGNAHNRLGFQVGPMVDFTIPLVGLGVDAALLYGHKDYKVKDNESGGKLSDYNYLMLPVHLKKSFSLLGLMGAYVKGGPFAELKLSGGDFKFEDLEKVKSKNFGMGLNFGVGVNLFSKVELGMDYRLKLTDNYDDDKPGVGDIFSTKKDRTWNINLSYFF